VKKNTNDLVPYFTLAVRTSDLFIYPSDLLKFYPYNALHDKSVELKKSDYYKSENKTLATLYRPK